MVRDMKWTSSGEKICITYEDGAVIVGGVDGNRLWGKELGISLALVEWSPDGRLILFCTPSGEVHIYDGNGNAVSKVRCVHVACTGNASCTCIVCSLCVHLQCRMPRLAPMTPTATRCATWAVWQQHQAHLDQRTKLTYTGQW